VGLWHQDELRNALIRKGWTVIAEHLETNHGIAGTWEVQRSTQKPPLLINFNGQWAADYLHLLPMPSSYACEVRGHPRASLYFYKKRSLTRWREDLRGFMEELDRIENDTALQGPLPDSIPSPTDTEQ
jgi:hypothetical protein